MSDNLKKFRKKGSTFDVEYSKKKAKVKTTKKKLSPKPKQKNIRISDYLEEE